MDSSHDKGIMKYFAFFRISWIKMIDTDEEHRMTCCKINECIKIILDDIKKWEGNNVTVTYLQSR